MHRLVNKSPTRVPNCSDGDLDFVAFSAHCHTHTHAHIQLIGFLCLYTDLLL